MTLHNDHLWCIRSYFIEPVWITTRTVKVLPGDAAGKIKQDVSVKKELCLAQLSSSSWISMGVLPAPSTHTAAHLPTPKAFSLIAWTGFSLFHHAFIRAFIPSVFFHGWANHLCLPAPKLQCSLIRNGRHGGPRVGGVVGLGTRKSVNT